MVGDQPAAPGWVNARPGGTGLTGTSDLNMVPSRAVANAGPVRVADSDGTLAFTTQVPARLVVDLAGWFRRATTTAPAAGLWRTSLLPSSTAPRVDTLPVGAPSAFDTAVYASDPGSGTATAYLVDGNLVEGSTWSPSAPGAGPLRSDPELVANYDTPTLTTAGDRAVAAVYVLSAEHRVYAFGSNVYGERGQLPLDSDPEPPLGEIQLPDEARVASVFAAPGVGYLLTTGGDVYSFGRDDTDQLGRSTDASYIPGTVAFPTGAPRQIAGDSRVSFGIDAAGLTTWWGSALPADGGSTPIVQATPALFTQGCLVATSLYADTDGVWELCADGSVVQLTGQGRLFASTQVLPVSGVTALAAGAGTGSGVRALLSDGRVADVTTGGARYEAGFAGVTAINGTREVQVTLVGS